MATIACPGCGLPREEEQVGIVPCPICDLTSTPAIEPRRTAKPTAADPTAGLPTDASELDKITAARQPLVSLLWLVVPLTFLLGVGAGVGGILGWQAAFPPDEQPRDSRLQYAGIDVSSSTLPSLPLRTSEVAPMPREPLRKPVPEAIPTPVPEPVPEPKKAPPVAPSAQAIVIDLNQPDAAYTVPFTMKKGEHVILRGKVKILRANGLDGGAVLDASGLEAASIFISGKIEGRSTVKLNAPTGAVTIAGQVTGNSRVEINATGGSVVFSLPTGPDGPGSQIDGGARVTFTSRTAELRGDVNGVETKVLATLLPGGSMKLAAVRGTAMVEYQVAGKKGAANVVVGTLAPTATLRKVE